MFHLTTSQREALRTRLNDRAHGLRNEISDALHASNARVALGLPAYHDEPADEAGGDVEASIEVASVERDAAELNAVLEALARMDGGDYGLCADCGAPIAYERLLAQPQAYRCVRCETERERMRARPSLPAL